MYICTYIYIYIYIYTYVYTSYYIGRGSCAPPKGARSFAGRAGVDASVAFAALLLPSVLWGAEYLL